MNREKPVLVLTDNDRIRGMIKSVVRPRLEVICVSTLSGTVLPMTRGQISLVIVDLASRAMSGDDLMAIARVSEGRNVPLILMTRQPRQAVKPLASVINARDVTEEVHEEELARRPPANVARHRSGHRNAPARIHGRHGCARGGFVGRPGDNR